MPSPRHDTLNEMFRDHPEFAVAILREKGIEVPDAAPAQVESNDFNDRPSSDFRPDTVITVGPLPQGTQHGIIVEVQQAKDASKRRQLPRYAAQLWLLLRRPVTVLCVCADADAAAYYAKPIETELPGYVFRAAVLGPDDVPVFTDPEEAASHPELAAMGVMVHGKRNEPVVKAFIDALATMEPDNGPEYYEYAHGMAEPTVRRILEELVSAKTWPVYSPFAKEHFGRGKAEGRKEGRKEGREEGREEGRAEKGAQAILTVLETRGIEVPESTRARIQACGDAQELDAWLKRAVVAKAVDELFG